MKNESADATHQATPDPSSNVKTAAATSQSRLVEIVIAVVLVAICLHLIQPCAGQTVSKLSSFHSVLLHKRGKMSFSSCYRV